MKRLFIIFIVAFASFTSSEVTGDAPKFAEFDTAILKLLESDVKLDFIQKIIEDPRTEFNDKFTKINVTGFLGKGTDYSSHYNARSVNKSKEFLQENMAILQLAENEYGVPKEVLTSILWIETRHGSYLGNSHVVSVYLSTAMADHPKYYEQNLMIINDRFSGDDEKIKEYEEKLQARTDKKVNWAIENLIALSALDTISPIPILDIKGSWAGAFGIPQFLPNSYMNWAVDGNGDGQINLFELEDAIFSCANYLKTNGWGETYEEQRAAVFHYNNSNNYVDAVLKLADLIKEDN